MCKVNFVSEFNLLMRYAQNNQLTGRERLLWIALFAIANDRAIYNEQTKEYEWPEDYIPIPNGELTLKSTLDKRGIETIRNSLKQKGLIDFIPGSRQKSVPKYKMRYLSIDVGCKTVPNDAPNIVPNDVPNNDTSNVPNDVPNDVPITPEFGCNFVPNSAPLNKIKERNIKQIKGGAGEPQTPAASSQTGGFVENLWRTCGKPVDFVPLPWD